MNKIDTVSAPAYAPVLTCNEERSDPWGSQ